MNLKKNPLKVSTVQINTHLTYSVHTPIQISFVHFYLPINLNNYFYNDKYIIDCIEITSFNVQGQHNKYKVIC